MKEYKKFDLIINVKRGSETIANARYKRPFITIFAADMIDSMIEEFDSVKEECLLETGEIDWKLFAIHLLEWADANLSEQARNHAVQLWDDEEFNTHNSEDRGVIEFEEDGMKQNKAGVYITADIDIEKETVDFSETVYEVDEEEKWYRATIDIPEADMDEMSEEEVDDIIKDWRDNLEEICDYRGHIDISEISFEEWERFFIKITEECDVYFLADGDLVAMYE